MKKPPIEPVTYKGITVKLYPRIKGERVYWQMADNSGPKRILRSFPDLEKAKSEALRVAKLMQQGGNEAAAMGGKDRGVLQTLRATLEPLGVNPLMAAAEYAEAFKLLDGVPLMVAVREYRQRHGAGIKAATVQQVVDGYLEAKRTGKPSKARGTDRKVGERYLYRLGLRLNSFAKAFRCEIGSLTGDNINLFLDGLDVAGRTKNNMVESIGCLIAYAEFKNYLPIGHRILDTVHHRQEEAFTVNIFTPAEAAALLAHATPEARPLLALGLFAGIRTAELCRLDWRHIRFDTGYIEITAGDSKTSSRRLIPIKPNLQAWLEPSKKPSGPILEAEGDEEERESRFTKAQQATAKAAGVVWLKNGMRRSFASYRLAESTVETVEGECGHDKAMLFQHYRELVTKAQAAEWFSIRP